jgi:predicted small metal-binding protein
MKTTKYESDCDDGFMVQSTSKDEVAGMIGWHVMMQHPNMKMSMEDAMKKVKVAKAM